MLAATRLLPSWLFECFHPKTTAVGRYRDAASVYFKTSGFRGGLPSTFFFHRYRSMTESAKLALEEDDFYGRCVWRAGRSGRGGLFQHLDDGYQEILTDPSYRGQIVTMTYTEMGNYGVLMRKMSKADALVVGLYREGSGPSPSNFRSEESLDAYLKRHGIVGLAEIDTRALVRRLRDRGA